MILAIRTDSDEAELYLFDPDGKKSGKRQWTAGRQLSEQLLVEISKLLGKHRAKFEQLIGIVVYQGPGSFTGLRIGVAVANALAYGLSIPILGGSGEDWLDAVKGLAKAKTGQWVIPEYGAAPNITKPKK